MAGNYDEIRYIIHVLGPKTEEEKIKTKKIKVGKVAHYFVKAQVGLFTIEQHEIKIGDTLLISGPTTGQETIVLQQMLVNGNDATTAKAGDKITLEVPFRVRLSDQLFKVYNA